MPYAGLLTLGDVERNNDVLVIACSRCDRAGSIQRLCDRETRSRLDASRRSLPPSPQWSGLHRVRSSLEHLRL